MSSLNSVGLRDVASGVQRMPIHLRGSAGPRRPLTRICWVAVANFPGMRIRPPAATELFRSVKGLSKTKSPAGTPWSGLGPISKADGPLLETMGHLGCTWAAESTAVHKPAATWQHFPLGDNSTPQAHRTNKKYALIRTHLTPALPKHECPPRARSPVSVS